MSFRDPALNSFGPIRLGAPGHENFLEEPSHSSRSGCGPHVCAGRARGLPLLHVLASMSAVPWGAAVLTASARRGLNLHFPLPAMLRVLP